MPHPPLAPSVPAPAPRSALGLLGAVWGVLGAAGLLLRAIWGLTPVAVEALTRHPLGAGQWLFAVGGAAFFGFFEGYKGFQRGFSPRVVARALHLAGEPRPLHVLLAPLFCMGLFHASRRRLVASWVLLLAVTGAVLAMRLVPQPARGIVDLGVVVGLGWGLVALLVFAARAVAGAPARVPTDLPASTPLELA
jgi:hypothetical protein